MRKKALYVGSDCGLPLTFHLFQLMNAPLDAPSFENISLNLEDVFEYLDEVTQHDVPFFSDIIDELDQFNVHDYSKNEINAHSAKGCAVYHALNCSFSSDEIKENDILTALFGQLLTTRLFADQVADYQKKILSDDLFNSVGSFINYLQQQRRDLLGYWVKQGHVSYDSETLQKLLSAIPNMKVLSESRQLAISQFKSVLEVNKVLLEKADHIAEVDFFKRRKTEAQKITREAISANIEVNPLIPITSGKAPFDGSELQNTQVLDTPVIQKPVKKDHIRAFKGQSILPSTLMNAPKNHRSILPLTIAQALYEHLINTDRKDEFLLLCSLVLGVDISYLNRVYFTNELSVEQEKLKTGNIIFNTDGFCYHAAFIDDAFSGIVERQLPKRFLNKCLQVLGAIPHSVSINEQIHIEAASLYAMTTRVSKKIDKCVSLATVRDYLFFAVLQKTDDEIQALHSVPNQRFILQNGVHYASFSNLQIKSVCREVHQQLDVISKGFIWPPFISLDRFWSETNELIGSKYHASIKEIKAKIEVLESELLKYSKQINDSQKLIEFHNTFTCLTQFYLSLMSGHRPVNSPFCQQNDYIKDNILLVSDKIVDRSHQVRVCPVASLSVKVRTNYFKHLENVVKLIKAEKPKLAAQIQSLIDNTNPRIPFLFLFDQQLTIQELTQKNITLFNQIVDWPNNIQRHLLADYLPLFGLKREFVNYQLGHFTDTLAPISSVSVLSMNEIADKIQPVLDKFIEKLKIKPLTGSYSSAPSFKWMTEHKKDTLFTKDFGRAVKIKRFKNKQNYIKTKISDLLLPIQSKREMSQAEIDHVFDIASKSNYAFTIKIKLKRHLKWLFRRKAWSFELPDYGIEKTEGLKPLLNSQASSDINQYLIVQDWLGLMQSFVNTDTLAKKWSYLYLRATIDGLPKCTTSEFQISLIKGFTRVKQQCFFELAGKRWFAQNSFICIWFGLKGTLQIISTEKFSNAIQLQFRVISNANPNFKLSTISDLKHCARHGLLVEHSGVFLNHITGKMIPEVDEKYWLRQFDVKTQNDEYQQAVFISENSQFKSIGQSQSETELSRMIQNCNAITSSHLTHPEMRIKMKGEFKKHLSSSSYWLSVFSNWGLYLLKHGTVNSKEPLPIRIYHYLSCHAVRLSEIFCNFAISDLEEDEIEEGYLELISKSDKSEKGLFLAQFHLFYQKHYGCVFIDLDFIENIKQVKKSTKVRCLYPSQVQKLQAHFSSSNLYLTMLMLLAETGMRISELLGLLRSDVCIENKLIFIRYNKLRRVKTTQSNRTIFFRDLSDEAINVLQVLHTAHSKEQLGLFINDIKEKNELIQLFSAECSDVLSLHVHPHMFRHYAISEKMKDCNNQKLLRQLAAFVGHNTAQTLLTVYSHGIFENTSCNELSDPQLCEYLKVKPATLRKWRSRQKLENEDFSNDVFLQSKLKKLPEMKSLTNVEYRQGKRYYDSQFSFDYALLCQRLLQQEYSIDNIVSRISSENQLVQTFLTLLKEKSDALAIQISKKPETKLYESWYKNASIINSIQLTTFLNLWQQYIRSDGLWQFETMEQATQFISTLKKLIYGTGYPLMYLPTALTYEEKLPWLTQFSELKHSQKSKYVNSRPRPVLQLNPPVTAIFGIKKTDHLNIFLVLFLTYQDLHKE